MLVRRFGRPGLLGTMARTAVIAGTATATANALNRRQARNAEQDAEAAAYEQQEAMAQSAPAPAADPDAGLGDQLLKLAQLHQEGTLTDAEFAAAKQRLLG
jgi:putative oligomerization/nucleic acid binding protein